MAKYNTFVVQKTKGREIVLVTSSARRAKQSLAGTGRRVEVWSDNQKVETIYFRTRVKFDTYITAERDYIRTKQEAATKRNQRRKKGASL